MIIGPECRIGISDATDIATDLNEFVSTFDQIYSRIAFEGAGADLLLQYFNDRNVRSRLARARNIVFDALEAEVGQDAADEIGERGYRYFDSR
ncbi:hypothetical protein ACI2K4_01425 [Micromonospora sp. NPDC050397]|uniref:hypothetical protein n=1 Tax=Micromonospora sp. NPDC050397 TaxID=3364279 RepID=UPI00384B9284